MRRSRPSIIELFEEEWVCPITSMPLKDPVITEDGHSYQKASLLQWFRKQQTSPKTGLKLKSITVVPNIILKNIIQKFQTQLKYEFQRISNQLKQQMEKNTQFQTKLKQLTEQNSRLKKQLTKIDSVQKQSHELKVQMLKLQIQIKRLNKQCQSLEIQNQQFISHLAFSDQKQQINKKNDNQQQKVIDFQIEKRQQKSYLPYSDYLMSLPVLYEQQIKSLNHSHCPIDVQYFLMHDWSHIQVLNLSDTGLDSESFERLANGLGELKNLQNLGMCLNNITSIKQQSIQKLNRLKVILFSSQGKVGNKLNDDSKRVLQVFARKYPGMKLEYQVKKL